MRGTLITLILLAIFKPLNTEKKMLASNYDTLLESLPETYFNFSNM